MAEHSRRSSQREASGPRAVESPREKHRGSSRRHKETEDREKTRPRKSEGSRSHKKESSHRRRTTNPQPTNAAPERPRIELDVIGQPSPGIQLGMPVEESIMISVRHSSRDQAVSSSNIDTSGIFAVTSLVSEGQNGERVPLEPGAMCTEKQADSIHPLPENCLDTLARTHPSRQPLGYFSFPDMIIRQAGTYRIRTTLLRMGESGTTTLMAVDSNPIKVEGRRVNLVRRRQQVYG
ncbi:hypothetical protein LTR09_006468 [Extremus antarcticus]|uniref:Velvet domain-containing protein n=1 Tax=Extremus antarcticus TaxID=702011 RepID=A0AAJ0DE36_9PEZI|nr:hypothetical protein LTR09_006468 [Extremus antarcticus]